MYCQNEEVSQKMFNDINDKYHKFLETLNDPDKTPINVFGTLNPKQLEELQLIRGVSGELQTRKEEDMRKAAEAKEAARLEEDKKQNEAKEEQTVDQEPETKE